MNNDDNLDLLDLDDGTSMDNLPDAVPFNAPRPKKPWLLLGLGAVIIILATYIIISTIRDDSSSSMEVDLDAPIIVADGQPLPAPVDTAVVEPVKMVEPEPIVVPAKVARPQVQNVQPKPAVRQEAKPEPVNATAGVPVRVIEDRKEVTFNPEKETVRQPVRKQATKPAVNTQAKKQVSQAQAPAKSNWYVQFGSYSTRALAESAEKKIRAGHQSLFAGKQFVILAAVLPNGNTTYRLRIGFTTSNEANGFCRNAKSDGVDCYVAK